MNKIGKTKLSELKKIWLSEITGIENYFHEEISQRKLCIKKLSKYVTAFDYIDKVLIVLSATSSRVFIISFHFIEMANASFTLIFYLNTGIIKKLLSITRNKKKKHNKILTLAKSKLNSIEVLVSQALIDMEINHEEFLVILNHKDKYEKMKERLKNTSENMRLNNTGSKKITSL